MEIKMSLATLQDTRMFIRARSEYWCEVAVKSRATTNISAVLRLELLSLLGFLDLLVTGVTGTVECVGFVAGEVKQTITTGKNKWMYHGELEEQKQCMSGKGFKWPNTSSGHHHYHASPEQIEGVSFGISWLKCKGPRNEWIQCRTANKCVRVYQHCTCGRHFFTFTLPSASASECRNKEHLMIFGGTLIPY